MCTHAIHDVIGLLVGRREYPLVIFACRGGLCPGSRAKTLHTLLFFLLTLRVNLGQLLAHMDFLKMHKLPLVAVFDSSSSFFSVYKGTKVALIVLFGDIQTFTYAVSKVVSRILRNQTGPAVNCII